MKLGKFRSPFAIRAPSRLRFSNTGLRALSLILAIGLWVFVNAGERGSVQPITVPVSYRSLPPGMVIMNHPPDFVKIEIAQPHRTSSVASFASVLLTRQLPQGG